jgi:nitrite reductase (NO-forming)
MGVTMRTATRITATLAVPLLFAASCAAAPNPQDFAAAAEPATHAHSGPDIDFSAAPSDDWEPRDPRLDPAPEGDFHEYEIRVSHISMEIAPGLVQPVWAYNGQIPGPTLRGKVGDTFRITFINDGEMPHSIDFHASKVAPNVEMRSIEPGEELIYEFVAHHAGVYMYHCGSSPVLQHTGIGKHGVVIIDPPDLDPVDHEFYVVQHELYFGTLGQAHDKMLAEEWDAVVFNGYPNQYVHAPIEGVNPGERVRMWVMNNGPSENSSFHVIGTIFDTVYKEGSYRLHPDEGGFGGAQSLDLQASQGGFVEFTFDVDGVYPFVTHKFANVPKGAVGLFVVGDVDEVGGK